MRRRVWVIKITFACMVHRGEIIEKVVRESGYTITRLASKLGKSRRHVYNIFENNKVDYDTIRDIGKIINHDFSKEFKELVVNAEEDQAVYVTKYRQELNECQKELSSLKIKYIELLEKYNNLLNEQLSDQKKKK